MIIALFTNTFKSNAKAIALEICQILMPHGVKIVAEDQYCQEIGVAPLSSVDLSKIDYMISLGGDGTILSIFHKYPQLTAPTLAINLGSLGFMADITIEEVYASMQNLIKGHITIQERLMLQGEMTKHGIANAINEVVIHRAHNASLIELSVYVDGKYLNTFVADGIILSTPNGSTAYSMSAGGPILVPELQACVLTPICPHTISNRPIVLMPNKEIEIHYVSEHKGAEVTFDGFSHFPIETGEMVRITLSERKFRLVNMQNYDYFATLRSKLGWTGKLKK